MYARPRRPLRPFVFAVIVIKTAAVRSSTPVVTLTYGLARFGPMAETQEIFCAFAAVRMTLHSTVNAFPVPNPKDEVLFPIRIAVLPKRSEIVLLEVPWIPEIARIAYWLLTDILAAGSVSVDKVCCELVAVDE